ncbi:hypothetical protein [Methanoculleus sp.]|uniref:hypothetical protein n=1 Tax=Methanoculleus sp. TaxID=90427 RepID=UPI002600D62D|nr:hypothetical protein [Methanoculleus sp.]MCK9320058.1 hypothetical protein [Methanoculleus sp.]
MKFNKEKIDKPKKIVETPKVGDTKQKIKFSFFPTRIDDKIIVWFEKYINIYEYCVVEERPFHKMINVTRSIYGWKLKERKFYS